MPVSRTKPGHNEAVARRRAFVERSCYVANPNPAFSAPGHHKPHRPKFIKSCMNLAASRDVCSWAGFTLLEAVAGRRRHFYVHARRGMNAMVMAMLHYLNRVTWQVEASVHTLTLHCAMDTTSRAGNHSITRGTRRIVDLERFGLVECEKHKDQKTGAIYFKSIVVTERFFDMIGMDVEVALRERNTAFDKWRSDQNLGLDISLSEMGRLSVTEYSSLRKQYVVAKAWSFRHDKKITKAQVRRAKRLAQKPKDELRRIVAEELFQKTSNSARDFSSAAIAAFNRQVGQRMRYIYVLAVADDPPDDPQPLN